MANDAPVIQNSKMLLLSLGLAAIVVILYNVHVAQIRNACQPKMVELLQYRIAQRPGDVVRRDDVIPVKVAAEFADGYKGIETPDHMDFEDRSRSFKLTRGVGQGRWVRTDDFDGGDTPSVSVPPHQVLVTIPIDPKSCPGRLLHLYNRVNILGEVQVTPGNYRTIRLINGLQIQAIGGKTTADFPRQGDDSVATFRDVGVLMPEEISAQWQNVLSYVKGKQVILEVASMSGTPATIEIIKDPAIMDKLNKSNPSSGEFPEAPIGGSPPARLGG